MFFFTYTVNTFFFTVAGVINQCVVLFQIYRHSKKKITTGYDTFKHDHDSKKRKRDYARFFNQKKVGYHDMLEAWRKLRVLHRIVGYKVAFKQPLLRERRGGGIEEERSLSLPSAPNPLPPCSPRELARKRLVDLLFYTRPTFLDSRQPFIYVYQFRRE